MSQEIFFGDKKIVQFPDEHVAIKKKSEEDVRLPVKTIERLTGMIESATDFSDLYEKIKKVQKDDSEFYPDAIITDIKFIEEKSQKDKQWLITILGLKKDPPFFLVVPATYKLRTTVKNLLRKQLILKIET